MAKYILKRVAFSFITLLIIASITFFLMKLMPGTPFTAQEKLTEVQIEILNEKYNLNDPVPVQYAKYIGNMLKGDLGVSFQFDNRNVTDLILDRIGPSAHLGLQTLIFGAIAGIIFGVIAALKQNTMWDYGSTFLAVLGKSIPNFVFAGMLQYFIGVKLGWFPVAFWEGPSYTVMPTIANAMFTLAVAARFMRTEMIEVLSSDYIVTAKAKGLSSAVVTIKHGLRNGLIPLVTVLGPLAAGLLTGSLVIERIFAIPGLGEQFVRSITTNDFPMIMGITLFYSVFLIFVILLVDILYGIIDPRIRLAGGNK
ncbi:oligopeptide ABC transporter permease [Chengkuizengella axinellae]|uniref:ABC transporter permease n=1 Tax=Chengkuizengella axinellae TaxID=3064388 RepID=A0ABT9IVI7_9BACL|nr:oligopeptide ABC transporter permease [Chengkuizengella sp. 2205SS18-9]MDP5273342.1 ABC transporter permease [Chengkuizengella sp. 2205SS18-9]